jgi:hypothetical protein
MMQDEVDLQMQMQDNLSRIILATNPMVYQAIFKDDERDGIPEEFGEVEWLSPQNQDDVETILAQWAEINVATEANE